MFIFYSLINSIIFILFSIIFIKIFQLENYKIKNYLKIIIKKPFLFGDKSTLAFTKRIKRLIFIIFLFNFLYFFVIFYLIKNVYIIIPIILYLIIYPIALIIPFLIALPIENLIKKKFLNKAKKKLSNFSGKKIGITGSFGKTSTKNFLYQILKEEFDVCATPKSFNTPMGVSKAILENLKDTDDFFIVEMGARHGGDIKFLADFVGVDFGIMTPIGCCHLESFGTIERIEDAKFELCERAKDLVVFNGKSSSTKKLYDRYKHKKYLVCTKGSFAYAQGVKVSASGSKFVFVVDGKKFECKTKLLGMPNIDNVIVAGAMAYLLGESLFSIQKAIEKLEPTPHRLELIKGEVVDVIDDSYNSNIDGFKEALEVLSQFKGRKIVVSPGMVELGKAQKEQNFLVGKLIGKTADLFVVMNETNKDDLVMGAKEGGLCDEQIFYARTRKEQQELLKSLLQKGDVVLFENDFPDNIR